MKLMIYASIEADTLWIPLLMNLQASAGQTAITVLVYRSVADLIARHRDRGERSPVVVFASSEHEVDLLLSAGNRLEADRLILVLPNTLPPLLAKGHLLRPRVLFSPPTAPEEIAAVLARMFGLPDARFVSPTLLDYAL